MDNSVYSSYCVKDFKRFLPVHTKREKNAGHISLYRCRKRQRIFTNLKVVMNKISIPMHYAKHFKRYFPCLVVFSGLLFVMFHFVGMPSTPKYQIKGGSIILQTFKRLRETRNSSSVPVLVLFTTWSSLNDIPYIYSNTLKVWASLKPYIQPVVFTNITEIAVMANAAGWYTLPLGKTTCGGVPIIREMFNNIFEFTHIHLAAYANSDILFNPGLVDTVIGLLESIDVQNTPILMIGKRIDVFIDKLKDKEVTESAEVDKFLSGSRFAWDYAADYFITNRKFPWKDVPDLVIGRPVYDNWLVDFARKKKVKVIDATSTINAVHQTTPLSKQNPNLCNKELLQKLRRMPGIPIRSGQINCATHQSVFSYKSKVQIIPKKFLTYECGQKDNVAGVPVPLA